MVTLPPLTREQAALLQDLLVDAQSALSRDLHTLEPSSPARKRAATNAVEVGQMLMLVTISRAQQDEDSGIGPLHRSVA